MREAVGDALQFGDGLLKVDSAPDTVASNLRAWPASSAYALANSASIRLRCVMSITAARTTLPSGVSAGFKPTSTGKLAQMASAFEIESGCGVRHCISGMRRQEFTISGTANRALAEAISRVLGMPLGRCSISRFPDGEISVRIEEPVRGREVFLVQPTSPPVNDNLLELLALADACRRASAEKITAVVPYFGYARSDKRHCRREPITASMVAVLLEAVGISHVVMVDLHSSQIACFFPRAVDNLTAVPVICGFLRSRLPSEAVVVSPDEGRVRTAIEYARRLGTSIAIIHKERRSGTETHVVKVVGEVRGRGCVIIDDMISTGGTVIGTAEALLGAGARPEITIAATHGLLLDGAREKLSHEAVAPVVVTDTIRIGEELSLWPQLRIVSVAPLIGAAIQRFMEDGSITPLFRHGLEDGSIAQRKE